MPTGLKIPVGVNQKGGAAIESNESRNTFKILTLAFSEGGDHNPFQDLGLSSGITFSINGASFRAKVVNFVTQTMRKFAVLARLDETREIVIEDGDKEGEVILSFFYIDLLTNKAEEFRTGFIR